MEERETWSSEASPGVADASGRSGSSVDSAAVAGGDEGALREILRVAVPAVVTMTSYTVMQFVDKLIVKELGSEEFVGVGNGGIAAFVPAAALMGGLGVINTYVSQNLGAGKPREGAAYAWNGLWLCLVSWALVLLPFALFLPEIFEGMRGAFGLDEPPGRVTEYEALYGRVLLCGMVFMLMARALGHYFYGIHRPAVVMVAAVVSNAVNVVLCYGLVLGELGMPQLGVLGAAISTVVGGLIELLIPLGLFVSKRVDRELGTRARPKPSWRHVKDLLRIGWPAGLMGGSEVMCWYIFLTGFLPAYDTEASGPVNAHAGLAALQYMHLSFMPAVGISIAMTSVVGKQVGAGRFDLARKRTWQGLGVTVAYMMMCATVFVVFRHSLMGVFIGGVGVETAEEAGGVAELVAGGAAEGTASGSELIVSYTAEQAAAIAEIGAMLLILAAAFQLFDAVAISLSGALRGAGDTVWPGIVTVILSWSLIVGGGWVTVKFFKEWGSIGPWLGATAFLMGLAVAFGWRFLSGRWERFAVAGPGERDREAALAASVHEAEAEAGVGTL